MHRFYVSNEQIGDDKISIYGQDVNHIKNVLRLSKGEKIAICNGQGQDFYCIIETVSSDCIEAIIESSEDTETELDLKMYLFQGLPKKDKMELIIQKAVELGVHEIVPVVTSRTIVKIDNPAKEAKKLERWQAIAESAAKQSGRGIIPKVHNVVNFNEALVMTEDLDTAIIPYEKADGIEASRTLISNAAHSGSVGVFIGPEGGFDDSEINKAMSKGIMPVTLGRRILRTETAGLTTLSLLMFEAEKE